MKRFFMLICFIPTLIFSQNKLGKAKEELQEKSIQREIQVNDSGDSDDSDDSDDSMIASFGRSIFGYLFGEIIFKPIFQAILGNFEERDFNPYPYYHKNEGEYTRVLSDKGKKQNLKLSTNYLFNNSNAIELNALYKPSPLLGFAASHVHFSEKSSTQTDFLDMSSLLVNYYRVREKNIAVWCGIGATYIGNQVDEVGFSYNLGTAIYPVKPISLYASWQESFINTTNIGVFKSQLKYHVKKKVFFVGYHSYQIAGESIKGPAVGFEIMF